MRSKKKRLAKALALVMTLVTVFSIFPAGMLSRGATVKAESNMKSFYYFKDDFNGTVDNAGKNTVVSGAWEVSNSYVNNLLQTTTAPEITADDVEKATLKFNLKVSAGIGGEIQVYLGNAVDAGGWYKRYVSKYVIAFDKTNTDWQEISVPLKDFPTAAYYDIWSGTPSDAKVLDTAKLDVFGVNCRTWGGDGKVYFDEVRLEWETAKEEEPTSGNKIVLFDDTEAENITVKEGYTVIDGTIKGNGGWTWINLKYGEVQDWSAAAANNGILKLDAKSGWFDTNNPLKVRIYANGGSFDAVKSVTEVGTWNEVAIPLSEFGVTDYTKVEGIGIITYASNTTTFLDNIRVEWEEMENTITVATQPEQNILVQKDAKAKLSVAAAVSDGTEPVYQWFRCSSADRADAQRIEDATAATYELSDTSSVGVSYYYCQLSAQNAVTVNTRVSTVTVGTYSDKYTNPEDHATDSKFRPVFGDDYILSTGSALTVESDAADTYVVAGKNQSGNYSQAFMLEAGTFNSISYPAVYSVENPQKREEYALRFRIRFPQGAQGELLYRVSLINPALEVKEDWRTITTTAEIKSYIDLKSKDWQELVIPFSEFTDKASYWDPKDVTADKWGSVAVDFDFANIIGIQFTQIVPENATKDETKAIQLDSVRFTKADPVPKEDIPEKEALTTDRWIFNDALVGANKILGNNSFEILEGNAYRGTHALSLKVAKEQNFNGSIGFVPKMTLNKAQQNSAALRFWVKLPGEGNYSVSLCNDYDHVEAWATANTSVDLASYISTKKTGWQEVVIPLSDFTENAHYWSNSQKKLIRCTFDFGNIYAISVSGSPKQNGTILVDDIYFEYGFYLDNNGNTADLKKGASVLQMIYGDSFGENTLVKGQWNLRNSFQGAKVGKAKLEITHPWDNSEFYVTFPKALDLSDKEVYQSAAVEFWVKLHGEISWYYFYLFNQRGTGKTDLGRSAVSINDFIDKQKIGEWQKVQIPLTYFTTDGKYVNDKLQLEDWEFDFSKVVGAGTAQLAAAGSPTDPLVEYDDVKITIGNLPDMGFGVKIIPQAEFDAKNIKFTKLDLKPYMTTGFADQEAGDGKGGWTDQGAQNDLSSFDLRGEQYFESVPFDIVEPNDNGGKSAIALRQFFQGVFTEEVEIPVGQKAAGFYVIHAYSYDDSHIATYTYEYTDGTKADVEIRKNQQIYNWWGRQESDVVRVIWTGENPEASSYNLQISLNMFPCVNPNPEKEIKSLRLKSESDDCAAMILAITLADQGLYLPEAESIYNPDTSNWYVYRQPDYEKLIGTTLDVSYVLDAPAGKHGYVTVKGENFVFEDGITARFWGTNNAETASFQSHEKVDRYVDILAASGMNMVRIMDIDGGYFSPNVFGFNKDNMTVDAEAMDQLCYFWAKCKEKGIYIQYCLMGVRYPSEAMNHPAYDDLGQGFKTEIYFDEQLQELTRKLEETILTWENPYTGTTLATDPCVAMFEINNESNLINTFGMYSGTNYEITSEYEKNLFRKLFNEYLKELYGSNEELVKAWTSDNKVALRDGESLDDGTVVLDEKYLKSNFSRKRVNDSFSFLYKLQKEYHEDMIRWLKDLGVKAPVTGTTNLPSNDRADIYENAQFDYLARHQYQSHPQSGTDYKVGAYAGEVDSIILNPAASSLSSNAARRVTGIPYIVNEFQQCEPNMYIAENYLVSSAIFSYQGWSGLNFPFKVGELSETSKNQITDFFQVMGHPLRYGTLASSSLLYHRNEIGEAKNGYYTNYTEKDALNATNQSTGLPNYSYIVGRAGINMKDATGTLKESDMTILEKASHQNLVNEGGEIIWTPGLGQFLVNTAQTQAAAGTITGEKISLDDVEIYTDNYFANITVSALGMDADIADADKILITAAARTRNTGAKLSKDGKTIEAKGEAPILVEQVEGTVTIKNTGDYAAYILNSSGERVGDASQHKDDRGYTVIEMKLGDESMHYEIVREKAGKKTAKSSFSDVSDAMASIIAAAADWIPSLTKTIFGMSYDIERGDYVTGLVRALGLSEGGGSDKYGDVEDTHQGAEELKTAKALKIVSGTRLDPYASMSRADAWVALYNALASAGKELKDDSEAVQTVEGYEKLTEEQQRAAGALIGAGLVTAAGEEQIDALEDISREEAAALIYQARSLMGGNTHKLPVVWIIVIAAVIVAAFTGVVVVVVRRRRKETKKAENI